MRLYRAVVILITLLVASGTAFSGVFVSLTVDQYHHFAPFERFQQYIPVLGVGYAGDDGSQVSFNFNLFEDVKGPNSSHSITPYTLEANVGATEVNGLVLINIFNKKNSYVETMVEVKHSFEKDLGGLRFLMIPAVRLFEQDGWSASASAGAGVSWGALTVGINLLDAKDYYLLGRDKNILTAQVQFSASNGNVIRAELHNDLGASGRESTWFTYRLMFPHLLSF